MLFDSILRFLLPMPRSSSPKPVLSMMAGSVPVDLIFAAIPYEDEAILRAKTIKLKNGDADGVAALHEHLQLLERGCLLCAGFELAY